VAEQTTLDRLARGSLVNLLGVVLGGASTLVLVVLTARVLPPQDAGRVFAMTSAFLVLAAVLRWGTPTALVLFLGRMQDLRPADTRRLARLTLVPVLLAAATTSLVGVLLLRSVLAGGTPLGLVRADAVGLTLLLLALPAAAVLEPLLALTRARAQMGPTVLVERVGRPVLQVLLTVPAALAPSTGALLAAWTVPYLLVLPLAWWMTPDLRARGRAAPVARRVPGEKAALARFAASRGLTSVVQVGFARLDIVLVAALAGPGEAAVYTAATRFVVVVQLAQQAVALAGEPALAGAVGETRRRDALAVLRVTTAWVVALLWPALLLVVLTPSWWLSLFGSGYGGAGSAVVVLGIAMMVATGTGTCETALTMQGRAGVLVATNVVALLLMVGLDLLLVPALGVLGAAIGWSSAILVKNLAALALVVRDLGGHPFDAGWRRAAGLDLALLLALPLGAVALAGPSALVPALLLGVLLLAASYLAWREPLRLDLLRGGRHDAPAPRHRATAEVAA